ncbi:PurR: transcription regulator associated with purine metabolism [Agrilactobacillus composti DSM 18527 = JCM 14202]|uniref:pur operon repressor n=1 Tax=Agrilactobacillus composti TaxID=398555 RepID=UPI00042DDEAD|nr:pur operon repressor [Agrilactobacillus composti]GAF39421.1 PurR: transcription regulator associated with purine metabolism [Agrilactobacillus composti DSM 18527 = JCM 14202]
MKVRRSNRVIDMTRYLLERPHTLVPLTFFSEKFSSAKSSISEDLTIIRNTFARQGTGILETVPGAAGGVRYIPTVTEDDAKSVLNEMSQRISESDRLLPGGYVYLSDLLGEPNVLRQVGKLIAAQYAKKPVDVVMTIATKGIPIAQSVAYYLNKPFVIVRRDSKITEGSTVSVNYVSGSSNRIEKMELSKRTLKPGAQVLVVDDFMKGGGTINGMVSMVKEFDADLAGIAVFGESNFEGSRNIPEYTSLIQVENVDTENKHIHAIPGNYFAQTKFIALTPNQSGVQE